MSDPEYTKGRCPCTKCKKVVDDLKSENACLKKEVREFRVGMKEIKELRLLKEPPILNDLPASVAFTQGYSSALTIARDIARTVLTQHDKEKEGEK